VALPVPRPHMGAAQTQLEDKYFLQKVKLGQGSFGTVWRGVEKATSIAVAVKQMDKAQLPRRGVKREDIEREVSVMKVVRHENILRLFDFCEDNQFISFVLEYCDGGDFGDKVKERASSITEEEACKWMKQIMSAIQALHSKDVCHRDIKPDNFMVSKSQIIKLADFGLATILPKGKLLSEKCGTPAFMAPEQMNVGKSRGYNHSVDVWAAGITMFMLMSGGKHPFVCPAGKLDEKKLAEGSLDFGSNGVFALFVQGAFSEAAKAFCRKMVNPNPNTRVSADVSLKDQWMSLAVVADRGNVTRRQPEAKKVEAVAVSTPTNADASPIGTSSWPINIGGWGFGLFGDDQNKPPNVQPESDAVKEAMAKKRLQDLSSQIAGMNQDPKGIHKENTVLKGRIEELEQQRLDLQKQLSQADTGTSRGYPFIHVQSEASGVTMRDSKKRQTEIAGMPGRVPMTSITGANFSGRLPPSLKVRYNSASAKCWLNASVVSFNEHDGTYNIDCRQHADCTNISPDPSVRPDQAWPPGSMVSYHSSSAGRWLDAVVCSYNEGSGGLNGSYNLDLREHAEVDRIRPRVGGKVSG